MGAVIRHERVSGHLRAACRIRWRGGAGHFDPEYLADFRAVEHNGTALDFGLGCRRGQPGEIQHQRHRIDRGFDKAVLHIEGLRVLRDRMTDQRSRSQLPCDCERAKKSVLQKPFADAMVDPSGMYRQPAKHDYRDWVRHVSLDGARRLCMGDAASAQAVIADHVALADDISTRRTLDFVPFRAVLQPLLEAELATSKVVCSMVIAEGRGSGEL